MLGDAVGSWNLAHGLSRHWSFSRRCAHTVAWTFAVTCLQHTCGSLDSPTVASRAQSLEGLIRVAANGSTVTRTSGRPCPPTRYLAADEWTLMKEQRFEIMVPSQNPPACVFWLAVGLVTTRRYSLVAFGLVTARRYHSSRVT